MISLLFFIFGLVWTSWKKREVRCKKITEVTDVDKNKFPGNWDSIEKAYKYASTIDFGKKLTFFISGQEMYSFQGLIYNTTYEIVRLQLQKHLDLFAQLPKQIIMGDELYCFIKGEQTILMYKYEVQPSLLSYTQLTNLPNFKKIILGSVEVFRTLELHKAVLSNKQQLDFELSSKDTLRPDITAYSMLYPFNKRCYFSVDSFDSPKSIPQDLSLFFNTYGQSFCIRITDQKMHHSNALKGIISYIQNRYLGWIIYQKQSVEKDVEDEIIRAADMIEKSDPYLSWRDMVKFIKSFGKLGAPVKIAEEFVSRNKK